jgi:arabinose-5-phosphate isomerase
LKQVRAVMHTGERLPIVPLGTRMSDAVVIMSAKGFGCAIVTAPDGTLAGIVTDGDLRRHMDGGLLSRPVDEVMTVSPTTITPDMLVGEALEVVESRKIGALVVAEDGRPVGLVHVLDLLRIGAA